MRILIVSNVYPSAEHPYHGIFVKEQVEDIQRLYPDVEFDIHYINGFNGKIEYLKSVLSVNRKINKGKYDLVHIHYGLSGMYLYWPFSKSVPTVVTFHGSDIQPKGGNGRISVAVSQHTAKKVKAAVVLNEEMEAMVKPYCSNTYMIPCAVDINTFQPLPKTEYHDKVQIIFPSSRERSVKNYPLFCEVLTILKDKYGVDAEERELKNMTRRQIAQLYSNSDLLLMTSRSEGSPQAVKEALACNLSCVSTPVGDVETLLSGVKDCYISKEHNAEELASLVIKSLERKGIGILGREQVLKLGVDEVSIANKIYALYKALVKYDF